MNSRQLTLILAVAVVLGAIGWFLFKRGARTWESQSTSGNAKIIDFPLNDVAHITIKDGTSELNLVKKQDDWVVSERADYPANFEQVSRLLQKVWDLKPVQNLEVGPSQLVRLDLVEPGKGAKSGTLLDLKNKDEKRIAALLVGKQYLKKSEQRVAPNGFPAGRYVMPEGNSKRVALVSDPLQDVVTKPERWLNRDFIKIGKPKAIAVEGTTPEMKWKIVRENESADWKFAEAKPGEEVDKTKVSGLASSISNLSFTDVLDPNTKPESIGLDRPSTATIETFDGPTYSLKIGKLDDDKYSVTFSIEPTFPAERAVTPNEKPEDKKKLDEEFLNKKKAAEEKLAKEKKIEGRPFRINKFAIDQLLKNRADLIKTEPSPTPTPPSGSPKIPVPPPRPAPKPTGKPGAKP